jgi:hypothetical protein
MVNVLHYQKFNLSISIAVKNIVNFLFEIDSNKVIFQLTQVWNVQEAKIASYKIILSRPAYWIFIIIYKAIFVK